MINHLLPIQQGICTHNKQTTKIAIAQHKYFKYPPQITTS